MGICLHRIEKKYYGEIVRNQTLFDLIDYLKCIDFVYITEESNFMEFEAIKFKEWYDKNKEIKKFPEGMEELYKEVVKYINDNNITDECEYVMFEWY